MNAEKRLLVIGGDGLIGRALVRSLSENHREVLGTTRRLDRVSPVSVLLDLARDVKAWAPPPNCSAAFLCAAITSQEKCRADPAATARVNVIRTAELAKSLVAAGVFVVFLSSNLVFDGLRPTPKVGDVPLPRTEYGRQKAEAEQRLLALGGQIAVVRLSKVLHPAMPLLREWAVALRNGETIFPLSDLVCSPIPLDFALRALAKAGRGRKPGIWQISGERDVSYAEIALLLAQRLNVDPSLVHPQTSKERRLHLEHLPLHTTMDVSRLENELDLTPPSVRATIDSVLENIAAF
jgi:dTDP-4-dehydrorhamnose reductase